MFDRRNRSMPMKEKKRKRKGKRRQVLREICPFFFLDCFWFWFWFWFGGIMGGYYYYIYTSKSCSPSMYGEEKLGLGFRDAIED